MILRLDPRRVTRLRCGVTTPRRVIEPSPSRRPITLWPQAQAIRAAARSARCNPLCDHEGLSEFWHPTGFESAALRRIAGDVRSRLEQKALELLPCLDVLDRLLDGPVRPASAAPGGGVTEVGVGRVESPRGATSCVVERDGDRIARLRLRTGSYANWPAVAHAAADNLLPDFPLINKSFELCYACCDR